MDEHDFIGHDEELFEHLLSDNGRQDEILLDDDDSELLSDDDLSLMIETNNVLIGSRNER